MIPDAGTLAAVPATGMLHALNEPAWLMSTDGKEHLYNQKLRETFPPALEEAGARRSRVHPEDLHFTTLRFQEGLQKGERFSMPYRMQMDGQYRWFESTLSPIQHQGQIVAWLGTLRALEDTGLYLQALMDNAPVAISFMDEGYHLRAFNQQLLRDGMHTREEFSNQSFRDLSPEVFKVVQPFIDQVFETGEVTSLEMQSPITAESSWWQVTYFPVKMQGGEVVGVGSISQNITPVKKALSDLEEQKNFLQQVTDAIPATISLTDLTTGQRIFANAYTFDVVGYTREEVANFTPEEVWGHFLPEDHAHLRDTVSRIPSLKNGEVLEQEYRIRHKDGHLVWLWGRGSVFSRDESGKPLLSMSTLVDITGRKQAELALKESQQQLEQFSEQQKQFVSEASHEIKSPIAGIQGNLEILLRYKDIPEEEKLEIIQDCHREALRLGRLVSDLLGMARGNTDMLHLEDAVRLDQLVLDTLRTFETQKGNHVLSADPLEACTILGDPGRLKQLLVILTGNALKYTPEGGMVTLSTSCQGDRVELRVRDTGIGIPASDLEKVFERFYRASHRMEKDPGGSGLGLAIARTIVEEHGGTIHLESMVGQGTTVVVRLPTHRDLN
ncbi:ATP-binding protein [Deinococcus roseus]|uniref:histidine kinase n=1 Tax=Deinococcus roseus TaxID=392414 RepID=A0ABQ2D6A1_9DEIO|nr:ATP-binding protein [Deinococcus roseus]GGJ44810.1 hypothetical protein GCM10008938_33790 [Deinococcus roseus]